MTDDRTDTGASDPQPPEPEPAAAEPPAEPPRPGLAPLAAGTAPGWYRTAAGSDLRFWDGAGWTGQTAPAEAPRAAFGAKYRRRFAIVLLVLAAVNAVTALVRLSMPSVLPALSGSIPTILLVGIAVGCVVGLVGGAALWTLVAAALPGSQTAPDAPRRPVLLRAWPWAIAMTVVAVPLVIYSFVHTPPVDVATIAGTKDGCHAYLDTIESMAVENGSSARVSQTFQALHDAAVENDPALAADLLPVIADPSSATSEAATQAILTRCVDNGDLTTTEIQDWVTRVQAIVTKLQGG